MTNYLAHAVITFISWIICLHVFLLLDNPRKRLLRRVFVAALLVANLLLVATMESL